MNMVPITIGRTFAESSDSQTNATYLQYSGVWLSDPVCYLFQACAGGREGPRKIQGWGLAWGGTLVAPANEPSTDSGCRILAVVNSTAYH